MDYKYIEQLIKSKNSTVETVLKSLYLCGVAGLVRNGPSSTGCYQRKQIIADFIKQSTPTEKSVGIFVSVAKIFW